MKTIIVIASHAPSLSGFRKPLLRELVDSGYRVIAAAPGFSKHRETRLELARLGVSCYEVALKRTGISPLSDLTAFVQLVRLMWRERPDVVLAFQIKAVIWGMTAAACMRVRERHALITGLGVVFTGAGGRKLRLMQSLAKLLYRLALARSHGVILQNPDDVIYLTDSGILSRTATVTVVNGSGVDLVEYPFRPSMSGPFTFLIVARMLASKGVVEFADAARNIKADHPDVQFVMVGGLDSNPEALKQALIESWVREGFLLWHGAQQDVRPFLEKSHVFVLPSYREGTPRSTLEAMATGRAVITTDAPGCRETVANGVNGLTVSVRDASALEFAMRQLLGNPYLVTKMGLESYRIAQEKYDVRKVNQAMFAAMNLS